jgi:hypothetical protein
LQLRMTIMVLFVLPCSAQAPSHSAQSSQSLSGFREFDPSAVSVTPGFRGHDAAQIATLIDNHNRPRSEFETSAHYAARSGAGPDIANTLVFVLPYTAEGWANETVRFIYDADSQVMTGVFTTGSTLFGSPYADGIKRTTVPLRRIVQSRSQYVGENAFGARALVTDTGYRIYGLAITHTEELLRFGATKIHQELVDLPQAEREEIERTLGDSDAQYRLVLPFVVPLAQAKALKPRLRLALVCVLQQHLTYDTEGGVEPTVSDPRGGYIWERYISVIPIQIFAFDVASGKILARKQ